ncbi:MAG: phosphoribosylamine--glycine ligase [Deltaproteobacteria bacterium]|nr:MAG: phosphoribosylamine--glycine ligase [Deltaproteobacteria bacterium]
MITAVIGSGGREHALVWKLGLSPLVEEVIAIPGNPGIAREPGVTCVELDPGDAKSVTEHCVQRGVELVVIGPEAALMSGLADRLRDHGIDVVGPGKQGAVLEGSKAFAKEVMIAAGVPTARFARVQSPEEVDRFIETWGDGALVVKVDGLAAGKGVIVCDSATEAREVALRLLRERPFGSAGDALVLEERLQGVETSYIVLTDGERFAALPTSQDHKRLLDGDQGPNTGGMGAFSPAPFVSRELAERIEREVIEPTLAELRRRGIDFRGFLYAGLMLTEQGPRVLEFNARLGDPETQVLLASLANDPVPLLRSAARGRLNPDGFGPERAAAVVVLAAEGYPVSPRKGDEITGIEQAEALAGVKVFHAGTQVQEDKLVTAGGRVLGVTAVGDSPETAVRRAYAGTELIRFAGMSLRQDIGKALDP